MAALPESARSEVEARLADGDDRTCPYLDRDAGAEFEAGEAPIDTESRELAVGDARLGAQQATGSLLEAWLRHASRLP